MAPGPPLARNKIELDCRFALDLNGPSISTAASTSALSPGRALLQCSCFLSMTLPENWSLSETRVLSARAQRPMFVLHCYRYCYAFVMVSLS